GLETVSLRYFNVFGPRQRPDSAYAAVIPLFIEALRSGERPVVHGDGQQTHSFGYIDDVVAANLAASRAPRAACQGQAYNGAGWRAASVLPPEPRLGAHAVVEGDGARPAAGRQLMGHEAADALVWRDVDGAEGGLPRVRRAHDGRALGHDECDGRGVEEDRRR